MNIAVIGTGTHGTSIAEIMALGGHTVALYDADPAILDRAFLRITQNLDKRANQNEIARSDAERAQKAIIPTALLEQCAEADFMIEAALEVLDVKKMLFEKMDRVSPRTSVLASTTTTFSITAVAAAAKRFPERVMGMHFFEPVTSQKLVEIVPAEQTAKDMLDRCLFLLRALGKEVVTVKDTPGYIVDRVGAVYTGEALRIIGEGQVTAEAVDKLMESMGIDQPPFRLMDTLGIDTHLEITKRLYEAYYHESRYRPHPIQERLIQANRLGRKTKRGFYEYNE
jgi:3-hydroxybutyryl-CoA dehydrogenase